jgi:murein DD-endopeptidase MepM/ murein hydrolase activator NlpD
VKKLATMAISMILLGGAYISTASAASVQIAPGEGISHAAKKAGCADFASPSRWQSIASQNGSSNWQNFNAGLTPGRVINVSCNSVTNTANVTVASPARLTTLPAVQGLRHPVLGFSGQISQGIKPGHNGIDFAMSGNPQIVAVMPGNIEWQGWSAYGGGWEIRVRLDNGWLAVYSHTRGDFKASGRVYSGQVLATMGCTGYCTGQHLHFELWNGKTLLNPLAHIVR